MFRLFHSICNRCTLIISFKLVSTDIGTAYDGLCGLSSYVFLQSIMQNKTFITQLKSNFSSGLVVFLVALPLCLGIALASGAPPLAGVISGIIGGIIVGALSNSPISVSGPAAGLTAILVAGIAELGSFELVLLAGMIAGLIQIIFGFIKAGGISHYFPNNVIEGMLAGIGVIIVLKQIPGAFGYAPSVEAEAPFFSSLIADPASVFTSFFNSIHPGAILITLLSLAILLVWEKVSLFRNLKMIPGALTAVVVSILVNQLFRLAGSPLYIDGTMLVELPVLENAGAFTSLFVFPDFSGILNPKVWVLGGTIAMVASIETLLCIEAADKMDDHRRITDTNLELKAQGLGNLLSAVIGGLPMTSVVVRSSANARAGATSKMSTIIHGGLLLVSVLFIPFLLNMIPLATLSAVLILVGYKLARPAVFIHFWHKGRLQFIPFFATMAMVVFTDLLVGVGVGMLISIVYILFGNKKRACFIHKRDSIGHITITLAEEVSFLNKAAIKKVLHDIPSDMAVSIDATRSSYIATDVLDLISEFANHRAKEMNIRIELIGFKTNCQSDDKGDFTPMVIKHHAAI